MVTQDNAVCLSQQLAIHSDLTPLLIDGSINRANTKEAVRITIHTPKTRQDFFLSVCFQPELVRKQLPRKDGWFSWSKHETKTALPFPHLPYTSRKLQRLKKHLQRSISKRLMQARSGSFSSDDGSNSVPPNNHLEDPILVYHENARSIVFRDHLRRANKNKGELNNNREESLSSHAVVESEPSSPTSTTPPPDVAFQPKIVPLPRLELAPTDSYSELLESKRGITEAEQEVLALLQTQQCCCKTIRNTEWKDFLNRFHTPHGKRNAKYPDAHDDIAAHDHYHFNSFVTSTSLLPPEGRHMRCYGSTTQFTTGVVFALPEFSSEKEQAVAAGASHTWSWPAGYSAKTEFNIDSYGRLINGRQEALTSLKVLRQYNEDYVTKDEYMVGQRLVSGLSQIPYNEVFLRVGGLGRLVHNLDVSTHEPAVRSLDKGVGLPVALFVRTAHYGHLIAMMRTRARLMHVLGEVHVKNIPLLMIAPDLGVRVLTEELQVRLWKVASNSLNPFQNSTISHKTTVNNTEEESFQHKIEELIDLDDSIRQVLTPEELARLAGGFGATDDSVATILKQVMLLDQQVEGSHKLQDVVNDGLAAAVRSGDFHTSRQLLLLYSLVASSADTNSTDAKKPTIVKNQSSLMAAPADEYAPGAELDATPNDGTLSTNLAPPPPPPLDTDRLRSATNSDGLLAVLGAAEVLKSMQTGQAKKRTDEVVAAVNEWVEAGEQSMAFRISSWYDQRAAQGDLKIAMNHDSEFLAFVSNKAIMNRKKFADQLREAASKTNFSDVRFLHFIAEILSQMHSPCLRLELLQYVLGLDNRYSVAHVLRSVELAGSCLNIAAATSHQN